MCFLRHLRLLGPLSFPSAAIMGSLGMSPSKRREYAEACDVQILGVGALYIVVQAICLSIPGSAWQKFLVLKGEDGFQYWDAIHYFNLSRTAECSAFFPLWPRTVSWLSDVLGGGLLFSGLRFQIMLSEILFLGQLPLALYVFRRLIGDSRAAFLVFALYVLGPNAIFFSIGYTESLFSLLSLCFLLVFYWGFDGGVLKAVGAARSMGVLGLLAGFSCLMNLARPALVQTLVTCFSVLALTLLRHRLFGDYAGARFVSLIRSLSAILVGAILGYGIYGVFCLQVVGDFWGPFHQQVAWGRTLAFRPWLLLTPRSLLIDLHGLYLPALLLFVAFCVGVAAVRGMSQMRFALPGSFIFWLTLIHPFVSAMACLCVRPWTSLSSKSHSVDVPNAFRCLSDPIFLYCLVFSGVHSLINLAANSGYLYSTSRHFFGSPFAFVALGVVVSSLSWRLLDKVLACIIASGVALLVVQWLNWAAGRWVG